MARSKPETKTSVKTEVLVMGKTEVEWEILGNGGPLSHLLRDNKGCWFVSVPVNNSPASDIKLRFHLKPNQCDEELLENYCYQENMSSEFLPETGHPSIGCSLFVDVLSRQENLTMNVSVKKLNEDQQTVAKNIVNLYPFSDRENIVVMPNFWTADQCVEINHDLITFAEQVDNARFHLTITAYDLITTGTEASTPDLANEIKNQGNIQLHHETLSKPGCLNGPKTRSFYAVGASLAEKSVCLLSDFARKSKRVFQRVNSNMLKAALVWMVIATCIACAWNLVKVDENHKPSTSTSDMPAQKMSPVPLNLETGSSQKNVISSKFPTTNTEEDLISISSCERLNERAYGKERIRCAQEIEKLENNIKKVKKQLSVLNEEHHKEWFVLKFFSLMFLFVFAIYLMEKYSIYASKG